MLKKLLKKEIPLLIRQKQDVYIEYQEVHTKNHVMVTQIIKADETGIVVESDTGSKVILAPDIKKISWKNITFINPKVDFDKQGNNVLNTQMDAINTQIIEKIKNLPTYYLSTRSARFNKNGTIKKKKISQKQFECEVFNWIKSRKTYSKLCPLALLNNELLLVLYQKRFLLLKKNFSMVFDTKYEDINGIVTFIFNQNEKIKDKRNSSLRGIAEDFL
jgi:hypothetical protein